MSSRPKVLLTRRWPEAVERQLAERFDLALNETHAPLTAEAWREALKTYDAVCPTVVDRITASLIGAGPWRVKLFANYGVGVSHIDLEACRRAGIVVTNTPDVLTDCTADLAMGLMLMVARRAAEGERLIRGGNWTGWGPNALMGSRVSGKTVGLIGFGRIGQATAKRAHHGFGMPVLYHSRHRAPREIEARYEARYVDSLEQLLEAADFVSLHCPGGAETRHLMNAGRLARMKPTAYLINTSRGEVVDEGALVDALQRGGIAGAGLDVYEHEPRVEQGLLSLDNVVLLPHLGSATVETRIAMGMRAAHNLDRFFAGLEPQDRLV